ncbi:MAG: type I-U CRISPR-associated helicase/endonuclease Cas3 [Labilithrix sp.]|nr:type I-U CRISPR-associated helicase/endonuclease Cas3 [Labilithrix sp.]
MADLTPEHFSEYFEAVHTKPEDLERSRKVRPFPWQERLLRQVARDGRWPSMLDLPTGSGKTAAIDVALFHLALDAAAPAAERKAPRRIVLVVDRRTVVDQAHARAETIAKKLIAAESGILRTVRDRLCLLSGTDMPIHCAQLRGGMPRDDEWAARPDQPVVAVSTVDQVGSRLLFRGYGISDGMKPIHAGLLGNDTLILLDEVHLSQPFLETLEALAKRRHSASGGLPDRWQFVPMSATPREDVPRFQLDDTDLANAALAQRLDAAKPVECREVKVSGREETKRTAFAEQIAAEVTRYATPGRAVGVVVNRVATAIAVFALVKARYGDAQVHLVTGRMRPLDRDDLDRQLSPLISSGRKRDPSTPPLVVVSTQCIEAGADFDFDALVTECASFDALRQRFGRLNRLGDIEDARGTILVRSDAVSKDEPDPVYGQALSNTWLWLRRAPRDFGIHALARELPPFDGVDEQEKRERLAELASMLPPKSRAPVLLPSHLDAWVQTQPPPRTDPDVALWLHGVDQVREADVQIVWRADISADLLARACDPERGPRSRSTDDALDALVDRVEVCPPSGLEALAIPFAAARAWLARTSSASTIDVSDVEGGTDRGEDRETVEGELGALVWRGSEKSAAIRADGLRPGMTIVVPSAYGGIANGTWSPSSREHVIDLGDRARWTQTGKPLLRLLADRWTSRGLEAPPTPPVDETADIPVDELDAWLASLIGENAPAAKSLSTWEIEVVGALIRTKRSRKLVPIAAADLATDSPMAAYYALVGNVREKRRGHDASTEGDGGSYTGVEVLLDEHMKGVKSYAEDFARRCGIPAAIVRDIELAARWHDAGKVDPRFQRLLRGGSALADVATEPLAKSRMVINDRAARRRARERSGYPAGARHELASVSLLEKEPDLLLSEASDRDLVLHLVASHHGWCRPFAPVIEDEAPVDVVLEAGGKSILVSSRHELAALDSGISARFWALVERYGWFGLAWLEAILRLADHRRSEYEQSRAFAEMAKSVNSAASKLNTKAEAATERVQETP